MYVTMALEYERKCTLLCMLDQTRKTPLLSQHHDEGTPICIAALENYPYLAYLQKKIWLRHPYPTPPSYRNFWSGEGTLRGQRKHMTPALLIRHGSLSGGARCNAPMPVAPT